jgi:palmitoyl-protein thioesterase
MIKASLLLASTLTVSASAGTQEPTHSLEQLQREIKEDPEAFAEKLRHSSLSAVLPHPRPGSSSRGDHKGAKKSLKAADSLPLVFLHGMGDSCFNRGMESITESSGEYMGVYSVCIPTGDTRLADTMNGFLMDMNSNVDTFAEKVKADKLLANGFNCVGLSQGNNICRGYIQRYNDPPVNTHLSIHGPLVGVAALPSCQERDDVCQNVDALLSKLAYTQNMQDFLFQADYFRDVNFVDTPEYKATSQMASWNNEGNTVNPAFKENFLKTNTFAMIKADADTVVVPREGEWFGAYADNDYSTLLSMTETSWYKDDLFGLKTAHQDGKIKFNSTSGNHLEFTDDELYGWLDLYC